jgi:hypothetical protein
VIEHPELAKEAIQQGLLTENQVLIPDGGWLTLQRPNDDKPHCIKLWRRDSEEDNQPTEDKVVCFPLDSNILVINSVIRLV